ncbi:MAG: hypothetical protein KDD78_14400, partial [Caldilineaceae bacterium]|nr:hypothetical protein [Caldilineaceae bacterium]
MAKRKQKGRGSSTSRRQATTANSRSPMVLGLLAVAVLGLGLLIWFGVTRTSGRGDMDRVDTGASASSAPENASGTAPERAPASVPAGNAAYCRSGPRFPAGLGYAPGQALIGTSLRGYIGLTLSDAADPNRVFQDPSWDDAGSLGSWVYDRQGNIYVAPAPFVSLELNPPDLQNRIYRIDTDTGKMTLFAELPAAAPPSGDNPFGVLGLFYDCDTESLYAGSVAGSTGTDEVGRLFQIDVADGTVIDTLEGIDAMGVGVFNHPDGKRLYF